MKMINKFIISTEHMLKDVKKLYNFSLSLFRIYVLYLVALHTFRDS